MSDNITATRELLARSIALRNQGRVEAVLRAEFASRLRRVFSTSEDTNWVNHYTEGSEAGTKITRDGKQSQRFIDNLVNSTAIEYESDLRQSRRRSEGYNQVKEYAAGTIRSGVPVSQVRGILSDTVDWYVYDVELIGDVEPHLCRPDNVSLKEIEAFQPKASDNATAQRFIDFLRKHLAREKSRPIDAISIVTDLGLESLAYTRQVEDLRNLIGETRESDSSVALATELWSRFVDYLERIEGAFRISAYLDEAYITLLARLFCANVLIGKAQLSDDAELESIINGRFFEDRFHLGNMVEQDYFGWLLRPQYLPRILPICQEIQHDLYAYDFAHIKQEDLFGQLMAQLARRSARKLLGQEWTPQWLAKEMAVKCLDLLPEGEPPRLIDMCCGSGSIVVEVLRANQDRWPDLSLSELSKIITGFDIDPLAVLLARTTWVVALAEKIRASSELVMVPIYHADSLFAVTPLTRSIPMLGEEHDLRIDLDGVTITLPSQLIAPEFQQLFDGIVEWCHQEAQEARQRGSAREANQSRVLPMIRSLLELHHLKLEAAVEASLTTAVTSLAARMAQLAVQNRNGIWAFILRNTYRPGLLVGQFNGLVSNPPWLTMSQFANNPYKDQLSQRSRLYGIKPSGAAHLHLELATTYLLHAIDRYLRPHSVVVCLLPGTILNGQHHSKFRSAAYRTAIRPVEFALDEVWTISSGTFKVRAAAVVGTNTTPLCTPPNLDIHGYIADASGLRGVPFEHRHLGLRTAWVIDGGDDAVPLHDSEKVPPQGADLMPRSAVCVKVLKDSGVEWEVDTPSRGDEQYFAVQDGKKLEGRSFPGWVAPDFIHYMIVSRNLLPFVVCGDFVRVAIPARRTENGEWELVDTSEMRTLGFFQTARRFERINQAMRDAGIRKPLKEKIDERNKLIRQILPSDHYLVVNGAGGGIACAACLPLKDCPELIVDQTLYWTLVPSEDEAWYRVGLMNSVALTDLTREFNPAGEFGQRHLHTLPNRVIPPYMPSDPKHTLVASLARGLSKLASDLISEDRTISDASKPLATRRRRLRNLLANLSDHTQLEAVCRDVLSPPE